MLGRARETCAGCRATPFSRTYTLGTAAACQCPLLGSYSWWPFPSEVCVRPGAVVKVLTTAPLLSRHPRLLPAFWFQVVCGLLFSSVASTTFQPFSHPSSLVFSLLHLASDSSFVTHRPGDPCRERVSRWTLHSRLFLQTRRFPAKPLLSPSRGRPRAGCPPQRPFRSHLLVFL